MNVADWNKAMPIGTPVRYYDTKYNPEYELTRTRSEAWDMHGNVVVQLEGKSGSFSVEHIVRDTEGAAAKGVVDAAVDMVVKAQKSPIVPSALMDVGTPERYLEVMWKNSSLSDVRALAGLKGARFIAIDDALDLECGIVYDNEAKTNICTMDPGETPGKQDVSVLSMAAVIVHSVNTLPKVVDALAWALDHMEYETDDYHDKISVLSDAQSVSVPVPVEKPREVNSTVELVSAMQWLLDDMTDAGEDKNEKTGDTFDSVANARNILAEAKKELGVK